MRVYIAGPYTLGDTAINVRVAIMAADQLLRKGHAPFVPHLSHFWHMMYPHRYETWLWYDMEWLKICGAIIRLPGESVGADGEVAWAKQHAIPVFNSVDEFLMWHRAKFPINTDPKTLSQNLNVNSTGTRQPTSQDNAGRGSTGTDRAKER